MEQQQDMFAIIQEPLPIWNRPLKFGAWFSGYDSQMIALKRLGIDIESSYNIEIDITASIAYAVLHKNFNDVKSVQSEYPSKEEMITELYKISDIYFSNDKPKDLNKLKLDTLKDFWLAMQISDNRGNAFNVKGKDLPYADLVTFSTPCPEFSMAGNRGGFETMKGSLTFESVRILSELIEHNKKPKFLLFENVPGIKYGEFIFKFNQFRKALRDLGYEDIHMELNAKEVGYPEPLPQNRNRVFLLMIDKEYLGDYYYDIPKKSKLNLRLKDMLEDEVDEKYYLSDKLIESIKGWNAQQDPLENMEKIDKTQICPTLLARGQHDNHSGMVLIKEATKQGYAIAHEGDGIDVSYPDSDTRRGRVQPGMSSTLKCNDGLGVVTGEMRIRKLTPRECGRLQGLNDREIDLLEASGISNSQLYKLFGNSICVVVLNAIFNNLLLGGTSSMGK